MLDFLKIHVTKVQKLKCIDLTFANFLPTKVARASYNKNKEELVITAIQHEQKYLSSISLPLLECTRKLDRRSNKLVCSFCGLFEWLFGANQIRADSCWNWSCSWVLCRIFWFGSAPTSRIMCPWSRVHRLLQSCCSLCFKLHLTCTFFTFLTWRHIHLPQFNVGFSARRKFLNQLVELLNSFRMSYGLLIQK